MHSALQKKYILGGRNNELVVYNMQNGITKTISAGDSLISCARWLTTQDIILLMTDRKLMFINPDTDSVIKEISLPLAEFPANATISNLSFSPDGYYLIINCTYESNSKIIFININTHAYKSLNLNLQGINEITLVPDNQTIIAHDPVAGTIAIIDFASLKTVHTIHYSYPNFSTCEFSLPNNHFYDEVALPSNLLIFPNAPLLATYSVKNNSPDLHIWNYKTGEYVCGFSLKNDTICFAELIDAKNNTSLWQKKTIQYWNISSKSSVVSKSILHYKCLSTRSAAVLKKNLTSFLKQTIFNILTKTPKNSSEKYLPKKNQTSPY